MDWTGCEIVEVIPGKVSGVPLIKNSRVPADLVVESLGVCLSFRSQHADWVISPAKACELESDANAWRK
jgi:uncharacterized protein (DUF433 family)